MKPSPGPWTFQGSISGTNDREGPFVLVRLGVPVGGTADEDTGLLAAAAPAMREMLLKLEWVDNDDQDMCPICGAANEHEVRYDGRFGHGVPVPPKHEDGCEFSALLERIR